MNVFPSNAAGTELLAVTESVRGTYRMDTATLATKRQEKFTDKVTGDLNTAHPKVLPNGDAINIVVGFGKQNFVEKGITLCVLTWCDFLTCLSIHLCKSCAMRTVARLSNPDSHLPQVLGAVVLALCVSGTINSKLSCVPESA